MSFPSGIVSVLKTSLATAGEHLSPSVTIPVLGRALRVVDPQRTLAVFAMDWKPGRDYEMADDRLGEPLLPRYMFEVQALVRASKEEMGRDEIATLSKIVRAMLYRDQGLAVALRGLSDELLGHVERVKRWGVPVQQFYSNELSGQFCFLSTASLWVEVEQVPA